MASSFRVISGAVRSLRRVLILADRSADWRIAGLRQLERLVLSINEIAAAASETRPIEVCVFWDPAIPLSERWLPEVASLDGASLTDHLAQGAQATREFDLVLNTHFLFQRGRGDSLLAHLPPMEMSENTKWEDLWSAVENSLGRESAAGDWQYVSTRQEISRCERRFLRESGKSQDGLVSRYVNRPISRWLSRYLLELPLTPSVWSALIFALPLCAGYAFLQGTYPGFIIGCVIFQLYSILDGCDGEIARAKFLQTEFGRRLDSFLDLIGNVLLAVTIGVGLARQTVVTRDDWFYISEGIAAGLLILMGEGIVFARRSRAESSPLPAARWSGVLYQRHHEFLERSGILFLGEKTAWWLVQLTKRDMALLAFLILALVGWPQMILHLLFVVSATTSLLAANAFLRQPAATVAQEAS